MTMQLGHSHSSRNHKGSDFLEDKRHVTEKQLICKRKDLFEAGVWENRESSTLQPGSSFVLWKKAQSLAKPTLFGGDSPPIQNRYSPLLRSALHVRLTYSQHPPLLYEWEEVSFCHAKQCAGLRT
ncbi:hypothetical protein KIL84_006654 [Mauremys mutica]|uniref:Uncharacterized protein n=1 Tax=Mauremys mutica TaxID=74926 RepID=A0A9D3X0A1_9SAUR|nr:hypothetical protein KIL84_006654 [Mauremys mutica]